MNGNHASLCPSPEWADFLQHEVLPGLTEGVELGPRMLEIGPGPGAATDWLRHRVEHLVALEVEEAAADRLRDRFAGGNVEVILGDATRIPYDDNEFDAVGAFTMLHHVPTRAAQNTLLREALRVLRPGGVLVASDSLPSTELHDFHIDDVYNPIDPGTLITRLQTIGFDAMTVEIGHNWTVRASKPPEEP